MKYITTIGENEFVIEILDDHHVMVNGETYQVNFENVSNQPVYSLLLDGKSYEAHVYAGDDGWEVLLQGTLYPATVIDEREHRLRSAFGSGPEQTGEFYLKAPMPGLVVDMPVSEGQEVKEGQVLLILESMKMQNELKSPRDGVVSRIRVKVGDNVERRQTMLSVI
jgi:biotin carboxyl carrier protein